MKEKLKAAGLHLAISLIAATAILILLYFYWFPSPLIGLGAVQGLQLILIVDLVVGPLCTLIVYRKGKPGMFIDLVVIGCLQVAALSYGLWALNTQKPSYMVLTYDGIELVNRHEKQRFIPEDKFGHLKKLQASTLKYEGLVPVFLLVESGHQSERSDERFEFEFNFEMPYYLNVDKYAKLDEFDEVSRKIFERHDDCFLMPIASPHGETEACIAKQGKKLVKK